jgi:tetratricopeptide (TPR) repeat protein
MRRVGLMGALATWMILIFALGASPSAAQDDPLLEGRLLRSAASLESRGDFAGAEATLRELMLSRPTSTGGLFALERVLRARGRLFDILEQIDAFLSIDPRAAAPNILKMRVYADGDDRPALQAAAAGWMSVDPDSPDVYREVARAFGAVFGGRRALEVLLRGREAVNDVSAFAMEVGDLYRELGEPGQAIEEWTLAVGENGGQVAAVIRRLQELPGDRAELARPLIEALGDPSGSVARRRAGARIALDVGAHARALAIAKDVVAELRGQTRRGFLADLARRAEGADAFALTLWAYDVLRETASRGSEARSLDQRIAEVALAAADTLRALQAQERVVSSLSIGSTERRRALAEYTRLVILQDPNRGRTRLASFREEFPGAPELDPLAVTLASRFQSLGEPQKAEGILAGIAGPRSSLERGYLQLGQGDIQTGLASLSEALPGVLAQEVTEVIALLDLLGRLEEPVRSEVARAASLARQGRGVQAARSLSEGAALGWAESPAILAFGARAALSGGDEALAAELWEQLLHAHPKATEAPEGILAVAKYRARTPEGRAEAMKMLEELILERPDNPLVPSARRELERLRRTRGRE